MLHIILLILKIIGIGLLCLLGLTLLFILLVLFVPVRYKVRGSYLDKKIKTFGQITWLGHAVSVLGAYDGDAGENKGSLRVRLFGIPIVDTAKPKKDEEKKPDKEKADSKKSRAQKAVSNSEQEASPLQQEKTFKTEQTASAKELPSENAGWEEKPDKKKACDIKDMSGDEKKEKKNEEKIVEHTKKRRSVSEWFNAVKAKVAAMKARIFTFFKGLCENVAAICRKKDKVMDILFSDRNRPAFVFLKRSVFKLIRHILPQKIEGWIHFGMDDPEKTGRMLGRIAVFYPMYAKSLKIAPDFEKEVFETKLFLSGRIRAFTLAATSIKIVLNKDLRRILSELKAVKEEDYGRE